MYVCVAWDCQANSLPKPGCGIYILCWRWQGVFFFFFFFRPFSPFLYLKPSNVDRRRYVPSTPLPIRRKNHHESTYSYHAPPRKRRFSGVRLYRCLFNRKLFLLLLLGIAASGRWVDGMWRLRRRLWNICWIWWRMTRVYDDEDDKFGCDRCDWCC
jgi:hypothetical protein